MVADVILQGGSKRSTERVSCKSSAIKQRKEMFKVGWIILVDIGNVGDKIRHIARGTTDHGELTVKLSSYH